MKTSAHLLLSLVCAAACTCSALADEPPDLPPENIEQPPAAADTQPAGADIGTDDISAPEENEEKDDIPKPEPPEGQEGELEPDTPDLDNGFLIEPEPEPPMSQPEPTPDPEPESIVLTRFDTQTNFDLTAIACGDADALRAFFRNTRDGLCGYDALGTPYDFSTGEWDLSAVDLDTPGVYDATAPLLLVDDEERACFSLAEGVEAPMIRCRVSVQQPGKPEIGEFIAARGQMIFPWVLTEEQTQQLDQFSVWLKPENGTWAPLTKGISVQKDALTLYPHTCGLENGTTCAIQVDYPGGQTGILTFVSDTAALKLGYSEGNRDGGGEDTRLPDIIQPAPSTSHSGGSHHRTEPAKPDEPETPPTESADEMIEPTEQPEQTEQPENTITTPDTVPPAALPEADAAQPDTTDQTISAPPVLRAQDQSRPAEQPSAVQSVSHAAAQMSSPAQTQPAAPVLEQDTADGAVLSGTRLLALIDLDEPLTLYKNGISFSLSADALRALQWTDGDTLSVTLSRLSDGSAHAELQKNGVLLDPPDGMTLTTDETQACAARSAAPVQERRSPLPFAAAGAAVIAAAACLLRWRKRL